MSSIRRSNTCFVVLLLLSTAIIITACRQYYPPQLAEQEYAIALDQPVATIWGRAIGLKEVFCKNNLFIDEDSLRVHGWVWMNLNSSESYCDCGVLDSDTLTFHRFVLHYDVRLEKISDTRTEVRVTTQFFAKLDTIDTGGVWMGTFQDDPRFIPCVSKGIMEKALHGHLSGATSMIPDTLAGLLLQ